MLELKRGQRAVLVEKLPDMANLAVGTLFFGQFLSEETFSVAQALWGTVIWAGLMALAMALASEEFDQ